MKDWEKLSEEVKITLWGKSYKELGSHSRLPIPQAIEEFLVAFFSKEVDTKVLQQIKTSLCDSDIHLVLFDIDEIDKKAKGTSGELSEYDIKCVNDCALKLISWHEHLPQKITCNPEQRDRLSKFCATQIDYIRSRL